MTKAAIVTPKKAAKRKTAPPSKSSAESLVIPADKIKKFKNKYGYFTEDGREYVITRPDTPRPWANVICHGTYGLIETQTGSGFSWLNNSNLSRINRWEQDLIRDNFGKYLYLRDKDSGKYWSVTWKPCTPEFDFYQVRHGQGYSVLTSRLNGITAQKTIFVDAEDPAEVWKISLRNETAKHRKLSLFSYLELCLGNAHDTHREFHKTFIETVFDPHTGILYGRKRAAIVPPHIAVGALEQPLESFHACYPRAQAFDGDKETFMGRYRGLHQPEAVVKGKLKGSQGKWGDAVASLQVDVELNPGETQTIVFVLGAASGKEQSERIVRKYSQPGAADRALAEVKTLWDSFLTPTCVETPDEALNFMTNIWMKYQAISGRLWGRCGYYQSSGGFGFRDQLQDSQIFFFSKPELARKQILLHAEHQFPDGTVYHWWHQDTRIAAITDCSDDLLWLGFITLNYLDETDDVSILDAVAKFLPDPKTQKVTQGTLYDHILRAVDKALSRFSPRGLPLIGDCDWNDGLSHVGVKWKGESIWLGHFLYHLLTRLIPYMESRKESSKAGEYAKRAELLKASLNTHGWDGEWYLGATKDDGTPLGSRNSDQGKIFLNCQTWAVISGVASAERAQQVMGVAAKQLYKKYGPLLLTPAYHQTDPTIGYITRYAPSVRENGGLYTHAGTWAVLAEALMRQGDKAHDVYSSFNPILRAADPDLYYVEPYVTPGNVDGPDSPNFGRGGWTWYTGSAAWYAVVVMNWMLGVRPTAEGLKIDPVFPRKWPGFKMRRRFRGASYLIEVKNPNRTGQGVVSITVDGRKITGQVIPAFSDKKEHRVEVTLK